MKRILLLLLLPITMGACEAVSVQSEDLTETALPQATLHTLPPSATSTSEPTPTASPTFIVTLDLSEHDPDIHPAIVLEHQHQLIFQLDETVVLVFDIINTIYCGEGQGYCQIEPLLYYSYGDAKSLQSVPLTDETVNEMEVLVARLPAANPAGESLRYYVEFFVPGAGYTLRYPVVGTIDIFATSNFRFIELPAESAVEPGDKVYNFFWGYGPNTVRSAIRGEIRIGPPAMDVASDGRIALLNPGNDGVLIYDPNEKTYSSFPVPFTYTGNGDLAFEPDGQLTVCDFTGQGGTKIPESIPHCYRLSPDGDLVVSAPVYVNFPIRLLEDLRILDDYDYRSISPFTQGRVNSREAQRQKQTWELPLGFVMGMDGSFDWDKARFADIEEGVAFEVRSDSGLGSIAGFEETPQGYLMAFNSGSEQIRAVWIDLAGLILKDVTLPNGQYSVLSDGQMAIAQDGSLYVMSSTKNGIEIHFEEAPQP